MGANLVVDSRTKALEQCELRSIIRVLESVRVEGMGESSLRELLGTSRQIQAGVGALIWRVAAEADRLAAKGRSVPAEELLAAGSQVRASTAKKDAVRSRTMSEISGLGKAVVGGTISADHVDSITRRFKKLASAERQQIDDSRLVEKAALMPPDRFDRLVKNTVDRVRQDHGLKDAQQKRDTSEFQHWFDHKTGMGKFSGQLDPERYETLTTAIDQHQATIAAAQTQATADRVTTKDANLAAQALVELVGNSKERSQHLPHITVVVDKQTLATGAHDRSIRETGNGHCIPPETIKRLACDAVLQRVTTDKRGIPINVGRKYRTATNAQWVALRAIYPNCAWSECERPLSWCQLHHIAEWKDGGHTDLNNLVPLCSTHHHRVHEGKWSIKLKPDRSLEIYKPDKQMHLVARPPTRQTSEMAEHALKAQPEKVSNPNKT